MFQINYLYSSYIYISLASDDAVAMSVASSMANGLVGTGLASRYWLQLRAGF